MIFSFFFFFTPFTFLIYITPLPFHTSFCPRLHSFSTGFMIFLSSCIRRYLSRTWLSLSCEDVLSCVCMPWNAPLLFVIPHSLLNYTTMVISVVSSSRFHCQPRMKNIDRQ